MRVFIDNCLNFRVARFLPTHKVRHATDLGYERLRNGILIATVAADFDVLITRDLEMRFQQNPISIPIPVIILNTPSNQFKDLQPFETPLVNLLATNPPPNIYFLNPNGTIDLPPFH